MLKRLKERLKIFWMNVIEIKRLKILQNSHCHFTKIFGIEIEDFKRTVVEDLIESLRKRDVGIKLEIKTIENIDF